MSEDLDEADVQRRLARLREEWGEFPVEHWKETWPTDEFAKSVERAEDGFTGSGYVLAVREPDRAAPLTGSMPDDATQDEDRVLLAMGHNSDAWGPRGGDRKSRCDFRVHQNAERSGGGREDGETYEEA